MNDGNPSPSPEFPSHAWGLDRPCGGHVVLIGFRGSGKSTVGPLLAARLVVPFIDTDEQVEQAAGKTISEIFHADGEPAFRDHERKIIVRACRREPHVIAVGGGAVMDDGNVDALRQAGAIVWLTASSMTLRRRIAADPTSRSGRPDLTPGGGPADVGRLLRARRRRYRQIADHRLDTTGIEPSTAADRIVMWLRRGRPRPAPSE